MSWWVKMPHNGYRLGKLMKDEWKEGTLPERWDGRTAERIIQILSEA
jgi:UDP-N-acetylglucosamine 2-epimerase (non-hydrolysing)